MLVYIRRIHGTCPVDRLAHSRIAAALDATRQIEIRFHRIHLVKEIGSGRCDKHSLGPAQADATVGLCRHKTESVPPCVLYPCHRFRREQRQRGRIIPAYVQPIAEMCLRLYRQVEDPHDVHGGIRHREIVVPLRAEWKVHKLENDVAGTLRDMYLRLVGNLLEADEQAISFAAHTVGPVFSALVSEQELHFIVEWTVLNNGKHRNVLRDVKHLPPGRLYHERLGAGVAAYHELHPGVLYHHVTTICNGTCRKRDSSNQGNHPHHIHPHRLLV